ncbi:hypothetical protein [Aquimarina pacifica]|uniref:hypothetical protein n=1 Tax=Aquimarina pacifica TaxID=1296415 RepID=UPI00046F6086|nr:hypothetical protein [Aquimarina pacifica]
MKNVFRISLILLGVLLIWVGVKFFSLSNLKPENTSFPDSYNKAKIVLTEMGEAHGIQFWDSIQTYNVIYEDEFYGFLGKQSHPFQEQKVKFSLNYIPKIFNGQLEILTGKDKGIIWGIQSGQTYKKNDSNEIVVQDDKDMKFWIPTYQYFVEFPSRIQEATALEYLGRNIINGIEVEGVLASWGSLKPQKDIDQYIIWIDINSKRIVKVAYTVREMYGFVSGAAYFQNYKNYNGLLLPSLLPVESNLLTKGYLHKMGILDFKTNYMDKDSLLPLD